MEKYKLNTGQVIEGTVVNVVYYLQLFSLKLKHPHKIPRTELNILTMTYQGAHKLVILYGPNSRSIVHRAYDWTFDKNETIDSWTKQHKL